MASNIFKTKVQGHQIIDAVKNASPGRHIIREALEKGMYVFTLGQDSMYPYENLIILADGQKKIIPEQYYSEIEVRTHKWGGPVYPVASNLENEIGAVNNFIAALQKFLVPSGKQRSSNQTMPGGRQSNKFILSLAAAETLQMLAAESDISPEELLAKLVGQEDKKRHEVFVPGRGQVRVKCGLPKCPEKRNKKGLDIRD